MESDMCVQQSTADAGPSRRSCTQKKSASTSTSRTFPARPGGMSTSGRQDWEGRPRRSSTKSAWVFVMCNSDPADGDCHRWIDVTGASPPGAIVEARKSMGERTHPLTVRRAVKRTFIYRIYGRLRDKRVLQDWQARGRPAPPPQF